MSEAVLLVGTRKGLWIGRSDAERTSWDWSEPEFLMQGIYATCIDTRGDAPRMFVSGTSEHWGPGVYRSDDLGRTWTETQGAAVRFPEDLGSSVERVWQIQPGRADDADVIYAGTEPSALFRSEDRGESFTLIRSLWDHPHRTEWGAGFGGQAIHTIVPHPDDGGRLTVAMSTGGVYQTKDGGDSWAPSNSGIKAYFFPDPWPEFGQCVHKVASHPAKPRADVRAEPPRRLPLRRRRPAPGSRSRTGCRRTSGFRSWSIRTTPTPCTCSRWWPTANASRRRVRPGSGGRPTPARRGQPRRPGCRTASTPPSCGTRSPPTTPSTTGLYFGARDGSVYGSTDGGEHLDRARRPSARRAVGSGGWSRG